MNRSVDLKALSPAARTELIYGVAKRASELELWRSALGRQPVDGQATPASGGSLIDLGALVQVLLGAPAAPAATSNAPETTNSGALNLGANQRHAGAVQAAAERTGLPAAALAAIVDAEAAKAGDGSWNVGSRNPRSSAAGLGQFLSGTWVGEAERTGTHLHEVATARGWLDRGGRVRADTREALLALRLDPGTSIQATADYARGNLDRLRQRGVPVGDGIEEVARAAYLAHHLGAGDAQRFLQGGLDGGRAATLLAAQVGAGAAARRIAATGGAASAHREWLNAYVGRHLRPATFTV